MYKCSTLTCLHVYMSVYMFKVSYLTFLSQCPLKTCASKFKQTTSLCYRDSFTINSTHPLGYTVVAGPFFLLHPFPSHTHTLPTPDNPHILSVTARPTVTALHLPSPGVPPLNDRLVDLGHFGIKVQNNLFR